MTRLYRLTHIESYLEAAIRAVKMLDVPISNGGLASELWGHVVYEEFPTIPYSFTLNGFMFCALGLYDLSRLVKQEYIVNLWRKAVDTLTFMVPLYDGDFMSTYCLSPCNRAQRHKKMGRGLSLYPYKDVAVLSSQ